MPKYQSHKQVWALKIARAVLEEDDGTLYLNFNEDGYAPIEITGDDAQRISSMILKHEEKGDTGYYIVYPDGYKSWSPTKSFEDGYTRI